MPIGKSGRGTCESRPGAFVLPLQSSRGCRKQQRDRDLYPCHLLFAKHSYASRAESRIAGGLGVPRMPENEATQPGERSLANLAAWIGRDSPECPPLLGQARALPGKHGPDLFRSPSFGRHLIKLRRKSPSRL